MSVEGQEMTVSLLIEPHGALVDDLAEDMAIDEASVFRIDGPMHVTHLAAIIDRSLRLGPRLRFLATPMPMHASGTCPRRSSSRGSASARTSRVRSSSSRWPWRAISHALQVGAVASPADEALAAFLLRLPEHRHTVRRVQIAARYPYGEVRDNLIAADMRAIDLLRCKLAFFGVTRFDPQSDKWLRITLFQGAPFPDELARGDWDGVDLEHGGGPARMIVSRNEIESLALKAARGAGMSWGLAEEASVAAGWLAARDLPWADTLVDVLAQAHTTSTPQIVGHVIAPSRPGTRLCPIMTGALLSDLGPPTSAMEVRDVLAPVWLAPFLARWTGLDRAASLRLGGGAPPGRPERRGGHRCSSACGTGRGGRGPCHDRI